MSYPALANRRGKDGPGVHGLGVMPAGGLGKGGNVNLLPSFQAGGSHPAQPMPISSILFSMWAAVEWKKLESLCK